MVLVFLTLQVPGQVENAGKHKEYLGEHELISPPACKCPSSYQTICPEARICPGTKSSVLKLLELI